MGLSSKLAACVCLLALVLTPEGVASARIGIGGRSPAFGFRGGVAGRGFGGRRVDGRGRRRGFGDGLGYGYAGLGLGLLGDGFDGYDPLLPSADGFGGYPVAPALAGPGAATDLPPLPPQVLLRQPPPACPLIIKIGHGLDHPAPSRVVYGRPICRP